MIEVSESKYWKRMGYYDGLLYCQLLEIDGKDDWRMMKNKKELDKVKKERPYAGGCWYYEDVDDSIDDTYWVIPVRDI